MSLVGRHPFALFGICLLWVLASLVWLDSLFQALALVVVTGALVIGTAARAGELLRASAPFALFGLGLVTTSLLYREDGGYLARAGAGAAGEGAPLFGLPALRAALALFLRTMTCGLASYLFVRAVDPSALGRALIVDARLPARFAYAATVALNAAASLPEDLRLARMARAMRRGRRPGRWIAPTTLVALVVPLLARAIRQVGRAALAMEARGFRTDRQPAPIDAPRWARADGVFVGTGVLALGLVAALAAGLRGGIG